MRARASAMVLALTWAAAAVFGAAQAQEAYPSRQVRVVVPFAAGGSTDALARLVAQTLGDRLGQRFIVENVGGSGGTIGAAQVAKAAPDGYTLLAGTPGPITVNPKLQARIPYDVAKDFQPITMLGDSPAVVVVRRDSPLTSVQDLIALTKTKPGGVSFGSSGNGSFAHLSAELFKSRAGIDMVHVPYRGTAPAVIDLLAGRIDVMIENYPSVQGFVSSGELRALAMGTARRSSLRPDLPTVAEAGVPGYESSSWFGLLAPAGTPPAIVARLREEIVNGMREPALAERLTVLGVEPVGMSPEDFSRFIAAKLAETDRLVQEKRMTAE